MIEQLEQHTDSGFFGDISWYQESKEPGETQETGFSPRKSESSAFLQSLRHFPYNENLMRALNTISLKCCLPSTDAIDMQEKIHGMRTRVQGHLMQVRFIQIHQVFGKK